MEKENQQQGMVSDDDMSAVTGGTPDIQKLINPDPKTLKESKEFTKKVPKLNIIPIPNITKEEWYKLQKGQKINSGEE